MTKDQKIQTDCYRNFEFLAMSYLENSGTVGAGLWDHR